MPGAAGGAGLVSSTVGVGRAGDAGTGGAEGGSACGSAG